MKKILFVMIGWCVLTALGAISIGFIPIESNTFHLVFGIVVGLAGVVIGLFIHDIIVN